MRVIYRLHGNKVLADAQATEGPAWRVPRAGDVVEIGGEQYDVRQARAVHIFEAGNLTPKDTLLEIDLIPTTRQAH